MKDNQIKKAIALLRKNGYAVRKITPEMKRDVQNCVDCEMIGEDMECVDCACNICIMQ